MLVILFKAIEWLIVLVVLFAFVIGAWRHIVEKTLGDPLLVNPSPKAKAKRYAALLGKVLWNIAVPVVMVGGILLECISSMDPEDGKSGNDDFLIHDDSFWTRDATGVWVSPSSDEDAPAPWSY